jgi:ADP-ribose pyrophosphatase YjhB (NUDIX family)
MSASNKDKQINEIDAFIKTSSNRFRVRACGIIIKDNCVLMIKNNVDDYYYSLGGAIHIGETLEDACHREVLEETGHPYQIDKLLFIHENLFKQDDLLWHEIAFYFLMKVDDNNVFEPSYGSFGAKEGKVWIPINQFNKYKAYPNFFSTELKKLPDKLKVITTFE